MDMGKYLESRYLKAADYPRPTIVTIEQVTEELVGQDKEEKVVVYFRGVEKSLILNKTGITTMIDLTQTTDSDQWIGHQIEIYTDPNVMYAGKRTPALRLRAPQQPRTAARPVPSVAPPTPAYAANPTNLVSDDVPDPGDPIRAAQRGPVSRNPPF